jgi:dihydrodiol dehydrogenase / D-xylose 1-dehydrogenase (NADP)
VVYIGSSHTEHVRLSLMMLNAGKHVLCEKPLAESAAEVKMVNAVAKEKKLFFMEVFFFICNIRVK